jgi:hypothetical protein
VGRRDYAMISLLAAYGLRGIEVMSDPAYLAPHVRSFFEGHLRCRRNVSNNTVRSYRDALKLLLQFADGRTDEETHGEFVGHGHHGRGGRCSPTRPISCESIAGFTGSMNILLTASHPLHRELHVSLEWTHRFSLDRNERARHARRHVPRFNA